MPVIRMQVFKYLPTKLYGFLRGEKSNPDLVVYFHLGDFTPGAFPILTSPCPTCEGCTWSSFAPPPVLGEWVDVEVGFNPLQPPDPGGRPSRAKRVSRTQAPVCVQGMVRSFDARRGYGFIQGDDGIAYHLHRSEVVGGLLPVRQGLVRFFSGIRDGKPRACYVKICR